MRGNAEEEATLVANAKLPEGHKQLFENKAKVRAVLLCATERDVLRHVRMLTRGVCDRCKSL
jgi:hypothetical protein